MDTSQEKKGPFIRNMSDCWLNSEIDAIGDDGYWLSKAKTTDILVFRLRRRMKTIRGCLKTNILIYKH